MLANIEERVSSLYLASIFQISSGTVNTQSTARLQEEASLPASQLAQASSERDRLNESLGLRNPLARDVPKGCRRGVDQCYFTSKCQTQT